MQSREIVYAEIGKQNRQEAQYGQPGYALTVPAPHHPGVEKQGVYEPCDKGPCLFGVPAPVAAPGGIGPHGA